MPRIEFKNGVAHCENCDYVVNYDYNYCPQCGEPIEYIEINE